MTIDIADFASFWVDHFTPITETAALLQKLEKANISIGVLSNIYLGIFELVSQREILPKVTWSSKVLSSEVGYVKPEERIYSIAEQKSNVNPGRILFIDDKETFLKPAKNRGWQTYQFDFNNTVKSVGDVEKLMELK